MFFDIFRRKFANTTSVSTDTKGVDIEASLHSMINGAGRVSATYLNRIATSCSLESFQLFVSCPVLVGLGLRDGTLLNRQEANQSSPRKRRMTLIFKPTMLFQSVPTETESLQQAIYPLQKGGQSALIDQSVFSIGREPGSDLVIPDFTISREHALIRLRSARVLISDRGSSNGTFINGEKINSDPVEVNYGDTVSFGRVTFVLLSPEQLYGILRR
jgi:hypothetical protein